MVIGFFMPLPLAMMIPFMGIQSAVMAKQFGENFQYGKRRISAMDNKEFNALTPAKLMSNANRELAEMIPAMKDSITGMHDFQEFLVREFLIMIDNVIKAGLGELLGLSSESLTKFEQNVEHFLHGHFHFDGTTTTPGEGTDSTPGTDDNLPTVIHLTLQEVQAMSDDTLQALKKKIVEGNHVLSPQSVILVNDEWTKRFGGTKTFPDPDLLIIPDSAIKAALEQIPPKPEFLPKLTYAAIFTKTTVEELFFYLAQILGGINANLNKPRTSGTARTLFLNQKKEVEQLIVFLNNILNI